MLGVAGSSCIAADQTPDIRDFLEDAGRQGRHHLSIILLVVYPEDSGLSSYLAFFSDRPRPRCHSVFGSAILNSGPSDDAAYLQAIIVDALSKVQAKLRGDDVDWYRGFFRHGDHVRIQRSRCCRQRDPCGRDAGKRFGHAVCFLYAAPSVPGLTGT